MREAAELLRINQNTFRHHVSNLEGFPEGILEGGNRRSFSAEEMVEAQRVLLETGRIKPEEHPHRRPGEACQVLTIFNLKGGSAKTSSVAHVGQLLGLRGYRVLLIDLDSQASLTNLFGLLPSSTRICRLHTILSDPTIHYLQHRSFAKRTSRL